MISLTTNSRNRNQMDPTFSITIKTSQATNECQAPVGQALSAQLGWNHFFELIPLEDRLKRRFPRSILSGLPGADWSTRSDRRGLLVD